MPINYNDYPPDWPERRERILLRAWYCCEHCGLPDGALIVRSPYSKHKYRLPYLYELAEVSRLINDRGYPKANACKRAGITWVVLTIAHLDHDATNWQVQDDRLAALCQRCHLAYDAQHKVEKRRARRARANAEHTTCKQLEIPYNHAL